MNGESAESYAAVFDHFGVAATDRPATSCYPYAPVFRTVVEGRPAALKQARAGAGAADGIARWVRRLHAAGLPVVVPLPTTGPNPARVDDDVWVAYPWIDGRPYDGSPADITAAGDLLGRLHAASAEPMPGVPAFHWPDDDAQSAQQDLAALAELVDAHLHDLSDDLLPRFAARYRDFPRTLPALRDADLPHVVASADYKANNLVYTDTGPVLVDPDDADHLPRLLDLGLAALLLHHELPTAPPRLFTPAEWARFRDAYLAHVTLTEQERRLWPLAVQYLITEWGVWVLLDAEQDGWPTGHPLGFLRSLAQAEPSWFPLP